MIMTVTVNSVGLEIGIYLSINALIDWGYAHYIYDIKINVIIMSEL
jgi:hypothetical protein